MGQDFSDNKTISINKDIKVVLFDQEIKFDGEQTVIEFIMNLDSSPILALKNYQSF